MILQSLGGRDTCCYKSIVEIRCLNYAQLHYTFDLMWPTLGVHHNPRKWSCNHQAATIEGDMDICYYRTNHRSHSSYHHISITTPHWGSVHTGSQVTSTMHISKSQHGGKVPTSEPQVITKIWLNIIKKRMFIILWINILGTYVESWV